MDAPVRPTASTQEAAIFGLILDTNQHPKTPQLFCHDVRARQPQGPYQPQEREVADHCRDRKLNIRSAYDHIHLAHGFHDFCGTFPAAREDPTIAGLDLGHLPGL